MPRKVRVVADVEPPGDLGTAAGLKPEETAPGGRAPAVIVTIVIATIVGLSLWYLSRPEPLLVQGEADSTRVDIAARVDGRVTGLPAVRGQDVQSGAVLVEIDNPELLARRDEAVAAKAVAEAELARINAGTRSETVAVRKAEIDRAQAELTLAQQTYDRVRPLVATHVEPQSKLDDATDALQVGQRGLDQAKLAYDEAVAGFTREEHEMAEAKVARAEAAVGTLQALVDQLAVTAPLAAQVFERNVELGEVVAPGVPLLTLVDLARCLVAVRSARGSRARPQGRRPDCGPDSRAGRSERRGGGPADRQPRANMPAGERLGRPATSTCGHSRSGPIRSTRSRACGRA